MADGDLAGLSHTVWGGCSANTTVELYFIPGEYYDADADDCTQYQTENDCKRSGQCSYIGGQWGCRTNGHSLGGLTTPVWEKRVQFFMG